MSMIEILVAIKNMTLEHIPFQRAKICQQYSDASHYIEELEHIYHLMKSCAQQRIDHVDSLRILWLKDELKLLLLCFEICRNNGMKIQDISIQLSKEETGLFSKGPSVIMRMYYQLLNHGMPANHIIRKKERNKKKRKDGSFLQENNHRKLLHTSQKLKEISKHLRHIENMSSQTGIANLLSELHILTSLAAKKSEYATESPASLEQTHHVKRKLQKEKADLENTLFQYQLIVSLIKEFITCSDMEQIEKIPEFTKLFQNMMEES